MQSDVSVKKPFAIAVSPPRRWGGVRHLRALALGAPDGAAIRRGRAQLVLLHRRHAGTLAAFAQVAGEGFGFVDLHVGVEDDADQVVRHVARHHAGWPPVVRHADHVVLAPADARRLHALRHQRLRLHLAARRRERHPVARLHALLAGKLWAQLDEELRLELGEPGVPARHRAGGVLLGEAICRDDVGELRVLQPVVGHVGAVERHHTGVVGAGGIELVAHRRLGRLVVRGQRAVFQAGWDVDPAAPVRLHDERVGAGDGVHADALLLNGGAGRLVKLEVGHVVAGPGALAIVGAGIPPDQLLALGPRVAVRIGGGAVVEDAPVRRPGEAPARVIGVLAGGVAVAAGGQIHPFLRDVAAIDPAAASRAAVVLQRGVAGDLLIVGDGVAADLLGDGFGTWLLQRTFERVVPGHGEQALVARGGAARVQLAQAPAQMHEEPRLGARVAGRVHRFVVPLEHTLRVGEAAVLFGRPGGGHVEDFGLHRGGVYAVQPPEVGRLDQERVAHDAPREVAHSGALDAGAWAADGEVLAVDEQPLDLAVHGENFAVGG